MIDRADIDAARGRVREGAAAIQNLAQLLRSPRVAPRSLARVIPEVRDGCTGLGAAASALAAALDADPATGREVAEAARAVLEFAGRRAEELGRFLGAVAGIDTKERLRIDRELTLAEAELGTVLTLVELVTAPGGRRTPRVDVGDVVTEHWSGQPAVSIVAAVDLDDARDFAGDPRLAAGVLELAAALVTRPETKRLRMSTSRQSDGRLGVRIAPRAQRGVRSRVDPRSTATTDRARTRALTVRLPLRLVIPGLAEALPAAARHIGFEVSLEADGLGVLVSL